MIDSSIFLFSISPPSVCWSKQASTHELSAKLGVGRLRQMDRVDSTLTSAYQCSLYKCASFYSSRKQTHNGCHAMPAHIVCHGNSWLRETILAIIPVRVRTTVTALCFFSRLKQANTQYGCHGYVRAFAHSIRLRLAKVSLSQQASRAYHGGGRSVGQCMVKMVKNDDARRHTKKRVCEIQTQS